RGESTKVGYNPGRLLATDAATVEGRFMPGRKGRLIFGPIIGCTRPFGADGATRRDLHQRVGLPALSVFFFLLLPVRAWPGVRADSSHIQKAVELISKGDMKGAEREARLSMADPASRPLASATLGAI